ncbi:MAG: VCBS repeat-containing protein, partial [Acidobacteria bacterium]|nr:VCBS repeat-containing protein [Acidobacteriota bacterium]
MTAIYNLATALTRAGERAEGARLIQKFQALRQSGAGTTIGQNYLEQGRYAEAVASNGAEPDLVDRTTPAVTFKDETANMLPSSAEKKEIVSVPAATDDVKRRIAAALDGATVLFDFDGDGDLDLFAAAFSKEHLYRNDNGKLVDVTAQSGMPVAGGSSLTTSAVAGDYDNDTKPD